jgi:three-Cys-motif partner protein
MTRNQIDEIGSWSEDKLELLRKYLEAYTKIMKGQDWCRKGYHYIDAFAGTGRPKARDEERYIDGSPRVALKIRNPFNSYTFIEIEDWRIKKLENLKKEFPDRDIRIEQGDCNKIITKKIVHEIRFENFNRGIIFLDPFSMDIEWNTIELIAKAGALEIFLNFPLMAINRSVLVKNGYKLTDPKIQRMNRFWGTTEWREEVYKTEPTLFPFQQDIKKTPRASKKIAALFKARLNEVFSEVTDPVVMTNSTNVPLYCLIFAGHTPLGKRIAQDIFKHYEKLGK